MTWQLMHNPDNLSWLIQDGDRVVGSLVCKPDAHGPGVDGWSVEIMWNGPTGDIKFNAGSREIAFGFIKGVELGWQAVRRS